ncbi:MAG: T9SS type A sorting domain-containing protein [Candidatus Eisenbacteria bacterium]
MDRRVLFAAAVVAIALPWSRALALDGAAGGRVCIVPGADRVYGFSAYSGNWTMTPLDAPAKQALVGSYLGFVRSDTRIYAFNSTNEHWYSIGLADPPAQLDGQDVEGATAIAWGLRHAYGIATPWSVWRSTWWAAGEHCLGGGSGGNFGIVWTNLRAHAYSASTGQWYAQQLNEASVGGIASGGLGIVWTLDDVYAFDPLATQWISIDLGNPGGVSATGSGNTAIVWSDDRAQAYSALLNQWIPITGLIDVEGGDAGGDVALVWGYDWAYSFMAATGTWTPLVFPGPAHADDAPSLGGGAFRVGPNPSRDGHLSFAMRGTRACTFEVVDASGSRVAKFQSTSNGAEAQGSWDGRDLSGRAVAAGTYWVHAENGERSEARRVVILP